MFSPSGSCHPADNVQHNTYLRKYMARGSSRKSALQAAGPPGCVNDPSAETHPSALRPPSRGTGHRQGVHPRRQAEPRREAQEGPHLPRARSRQEDRVRRESGLHGCATSPGTRHYFPTHSPAERCANTMRVPLTPPPGACAPPPRVPAGIMRESKEVVPEVVVSLNGRIIEVNESFESAQKPSLLFLHPCSCRLSLSRS